MTTHQLQGCCNFSWTFSDASQTQKSHYLILGIFQPYMIWKPANEWHQKWWWKMSHRSRLRNLDVAVAANYSVFSQRRRRSSIPISMFHRRARGLFLSAARAKNLMCIINTGDGMFGLALVHTTSYISIRRRKGTDVSRWQRSPRWDPQ